MYCQDDKLSFPKLFPQKKMPWNHFSTIPRHLPSYSLISPFLPGQTSRRKEKSLAFNGNMFLLFHCWFRFFLRNEQFQDTMLELSLYILLLDILAYIEASAAGTCVTLPADILAGLLLFLLTSDSCYLDGISSY